jgi:progressive ankylosis protein
MIIEAPIIMLMSASTALVTGRNSYKKLKRFTDILNVGITGIQLIILIPPVFNYIVTGLMEVPEEIARLAHVAFIIFLPWAASIGYRRFYQGILIRNNLTRRVTYGTMIRLSVIVIMGILLFTAGVKGAYVGAGAMSLAVFCEAIATRMMVAGTLKKLLRRKILRMVNLRLRSIAKFYYPLALTSLLSLGVHPFVTFFLGKELYGSGVAGCSPCCGFTGLYFQKPGIIIPGGEYCTDREKRQNYRILRNFAIYLGIVVTLSDIVNCIHPPG